MNEASEGICQDDGCESGSKDAEEVELPELAAAKVPFDHGAEHPQIQHVEEEVTEAVVEKTVGQQLVDASMNDSTRQETESPSDRIRRTALPRPCQEELQQKHGHVDPDQNLDSPGEGRE